MSRDDRQTGKTTRLMEEAVDLLAEGHNVYITGAHTRWLLDLQMRFKEEGLTGVYFLTLSQVLDGKLRGCTGRLLVDDLSDMNSRDAERVLRERQIMHARPAPRRDPGKIILKMEPLRRSPKQWLYEEVWWRFVGWPNERRRMGWKR